MTTKKRVKKVKAYAVEYPAFFKLRYWPAMAQWATTVEAAEFRAKQLKSELFGFEAVIVPCTITYSLPLTTQKKKQRV